MNKKTDKLKLPPGWRTVKDSYEPKPGEAKSYSTDFGWIVTGEPKQKVEPAPGKKEKKEEVKNG
jgi:hypothetical protein